MARSGYTHATQVQVIAIHKLLEQHLTVVTPIALPNEKGLVAYKQGYDDEAIAKIVGGVSKHSVAGVRTNVFGILQKPTSPAVKEVDALRARVTFLEDRFDKLCETLSLNQIVKVRHLMTSHTPLTAAKAS